MKDLDANNWAVWLGIHTFGDPELEKLVRKVAEWRRAVAANLPPRWLSLIGDSGVGKTHCAKKLEKSLSGDPRWNSEAYSYVPRLIHWPSFVEQLRAKENEPAFGLYRDAMRWRYLILDDIFAERDTTGFASEKLATLLGCRCGKWTVITSNLPMPHIAARDTRIADRMARDNGIIADIRTKSFALRKNP